MYKHMPFLKSTFNLYTSFSLDDTAKELGQDVSQPLSVTGSVICFVIGWQSNWHK